MFVLLVLLQAAYPFELFQLLAALALKFTILFTALSWIDYVQPWNSYDQPQLSGLACMKKSADPLVENLLFHRLRVAQPGSLETNDALAIDQDNCGNSGRSIKTHKSHHLVEGSPAHRESRRVLFSEVFNLQISVWIKSNI